MTHHVARQQHRFSAAERQAYQLVLLGILGVLFFFDTLVQSAL